MLHATYLKSWLPFLLGALALSALLACSPGKRAGGKPLVQDSSIVFEPRGAYASMRIPALVLTHKGTLLAFCEGRIGTASDWADMDLLLRRSLDGGKTWETPLVIAPRQGGKPTSNPTPIVDRDGTIHLLYQRDYLRAYYTRSKDDGKTWSDAVDITYVFDRFKPEYNWKVLAPGPGHSIQLQSGRLLVPVWLSDPDRLVPKRSHGPSCVATIYSDDGGATWERGAIVANNTPEIKSPNESMAVQLDDGRVLLNMRNPSEVRRKAISYSPDGATGWTKPVFDEELFEPVCMASLIKAPLKKGPSASVLLFVNPDSQDIPKHPRQNLAVKLSYDNGGSWPVERVIEPGPAGYSDIAVGPDGTVYVLYETNTVARGWNYSLVLKKFRLNSLTRSHKNYP